MNDKTTPFWRTKTLDQMTTDEWESLCDGCGQCCLHKLEDADSGEVFYTSVACRLLDLKNCKCKNYEKRKKFVPDCVVLKPEFVDKFKWLPDTCAYRLISERKDLYDWHPLKSGSAQSVHQADISVKSFAISERDAGDLEDYILPQDRDVQDNA